MKETIEDVKVLISVPVYAFSPGLERGRGSPTADATADNLINPPDFSQALTISHPHIP